MMKYKVFGDKLPAVSIQLDANESIYTQSGGMTWMTDNFNMETNVRGGLMKGLGRMLSGESLFMATYTSLANGAEMTLASSFPGAIIALELDVPERTASDWVQKARAAGWLVGMTSNVGRPAGA